MNTLRNRVNLIGSVGMDPEYKSLESGRKTARFTMATTDEYKDSEGSKVSETTWHNIVAYDGLADLIMEYLKKGKEVAVEGKITYNAYEDRKGVTKYVTEIIITDFLILKQPK